MEPPSSNHQPEITNPTPSPHPGPEAWMDFLYDESPRAERRALQQHLEACPACQSQVREWRSAMGALDSTAQPRETRSRPVPAWAQWAAAAVLLLGLGFLGGRASAPKPDLAALRQQLEGPLQATLEKQFTARFLPQAAARLEGDWRSRMNSQAAATLTNAVALSYDQAAGLVQQLAAQVQADSTRQKEFLLAALRQIEVQRLADYAALRKELETVAVLTEENFRRAQRQLAHLAAYNPQ